MASAFATRADSAVQPVRSDADNERKAVCGKLAVRAIVEVFDLIISYLTGISEGFEIFECLFGSCTEDGAEGVFASMARIVKAMCPLTKDIKAVVRESQVIQSYRQLRETERPILENVCLEPLRRGREDCSIYQRASKGCRKEAGAWMPYSPGGGVLHRYGDTYEGSIACESDPEWLIHCSAGRPQEPVEDFAVRVKLLKERDVLVTCSPKCHRRVKAYLHGLGGRMWHEAFYVVRGTKPVPKKLLEALQEDADKRRRHGGWWGEPGELDEMIDKLDCESQVEC